MTVAHDASVYKDLPEGERPPKPGSDFVRGFGSHLLAEFIDGSPLGPVYVTVFRFHTEPLDTVFENEPFWGLLELESQPSTDVLRRLIAGDGVRLQQRDDRPGSLPVPSLVVCAVFNVRGEPPRYLIYEFDQ